MSGRKQFDEDHALESAMILFWNKGYEATSLTDLESAMGLNKSSIYNAYRNKEELFLLCLERYSSQFGMQALKELEHPQIKDAIGNFFDQLLNRFADPQMPNGCLAAMAAIEMGGVSQMATSKVTTGLNGMHACFEKRCLQAVKAGQLQADTDCAALAAMMLSMTRGIAVLNRGYGNADTARQAVKGMLDAIIPPPHS